MEEILLWYQSKRKDVIGYDKFVIKDDEKIYGYEEEPSYEEFERYDLRFSQEGTFSDVTTNKKEVFA